MTEAVFWTTRARGYLIGECRKARLRCHVERVENAVAVGTPDVDYCIASATGKLELKYAARHPVRDTTAVLGQSKGLRRSQIVWAARRIHAGGRVLLLVGTPDAMWLLDLSRMPLPQWAGIELLSAPGLAQAAAWHNVHPVGTTLPQALVRAPGPLVVK